MGGMGYQGTERYIIYIHRFTLAVFIFKQPKKSVYRKPKACYHRGMRENNAREKMEQDLLHFANKHSLSRVKFSSVHFDLDYQRNSDNQLYLHTEKAVIRTLGKVTKVPIGENEQYKTFEEAEEATKKYWQEYYKNVRAKRSETERRAEARRQKRYRERKKAEDEEFTKRR